MYKYNKLNRLAVHILCSTQRQNA